MGGGGTAGKNRRAKIQSVQPGSVNGIISVKLLTSSDTTPDDAFNVYVFGDKSTTDVTKGLPVLATTGKYSVVFVTKSNDGNWYLMSPSVAYLGACS